MLAVVLGWVLWHSSVSVTPAGDTWSPAERRGRVESVRACEAERARHIEAVRRQYPTTTPVEYPRGIVVREGDRATIHLYYCLPSHTRLD